MGEKIDGLIVSNEAGRGAWARLSMGVKWLKVSWRMVGAKRVGDDLKKYAPHSVSLGCA